MAGNKAGKNKPKGNRHCKPSGRAMRAPAERLIAAIDIGSNSVRLVVFQGLSRLPEIMFNERVLCGLGRDVSRTGKMDKASRKKALATLRRFAELCRDMDVDEIEAVATAAMRDAENGPKFAARIERECGFPVKILSGEEEARLSAYGVLCGFPDAEGLVADLGGGSLELACIEGGKIGERVSLPLGPVRLLAGDKTPSLADLDKIKETLHAVAWLEGAAKGGLYLVGGAWRVISRLNLEHKGVPLPVLQGYRMSADEIGDFAAGIWLGDLEGLKGIGRVPQRRLLTLPLAAWILMELMNLTNPAEVVVSAFGIREGIQYKKLNHAVRAQDALIFTCRRIAVQTGRFPEHADKLMAWIDPVFVDEPKALNRLRYATCLLSDISWRGHPDFRAESAYYETLHGRFVSVGHTDRALMAYALFLCYGGPANDPFVRAALQLLSEQEVRYATILGLALRLGQRLTGGTARPLEYSRLKLERGTLALHLPETREDMAGDAVRSRLEALAGALGVEDRIDLAEESG